MYQHFKKGKITATIGPATEKPDQIDKLIYRGVNVFRLNFSHGSHKEHKKRIEDIRAISRKREVPVAILLDTKGPEIRVGSFKNGFADVKKGDELTIVCDKDIEGDAKQFSISHRNLDGDVRVGSRILLDDGQLELKVTGTSKGKIKVTALNRYRILNNKGVNCPGTPTSLEFISKRDEEDIKFGCQERVNYIAPSFVRRKQDIIELRELIKKCKGTADIKLISKIECQEAIDNFDEILEVSDGIMVARGDLGVEIPYESVPRYQQMMIEKCNRAGKPVIVATQMLQSMTEAPYPTRAEVSDVYWAMHLGADSTMLSGESAAGDWPNESVRVMYRVSRRAENDLDFEAINKKQLLALKDRKNPYIDLVDKVAKKMRGDRYHSLILVIDDVDHDLVRALSIMRTRFGIIPLVKDLRRAENMSLLWGLQPIVVKNISDYYDRDKLIELAKKRNYRGGEKIMYMIPDNNNNYTLQTIVA